MKRDSMKDDGLKNLISIYREAFQLPENLNHYSGSDFKHAERNYVKHMLQTRDLSDAGPHNPVPQ